jgi:hypothetical protein
MMRGRGVVCLLLLLLSAPPARAQAPSLADASSRACTADADCVIFTPPCRSPVAINQRAAESFSAWAREAAPGFHCHVAKVNPRNRPFCVSGFCALRTVESR